MGSFVKSFLCARAGERFTVVHFLVFSLLFLQLSIQLEQNRIGVFLRGVIEPPPKAMTMNIDDLTYEDETTHQHLIGFPIFARLMRVDSQDAWMLYPLMVAILFPSLWLYLVWVWRVPMLMASCLILAIFNTPVVSGIGIEPNSDFFVNSVVIGLFLYIMHRPEAYLSIGLIFLFAMLVHQRALVLLPAAIVWSVYWSEGQPNCPFVVKPKRYLKAAVPFLIAAAVFLAYKSLFYYYFPAKFPLRRLDVTQQFRQLLRLPSEHNLEGSILHYIVSLRNWEVWHLFYFSFVVLTVGALIKKSYTLALVALLLYLGSISQLLVAEDVHRLTSFLFIISLILAIEASQKDWPIYWSTCAFFVVAFLSSGVLHFGLGIQKWMNKAFSGLALGSW